MAQEYSNKLVFTGVLGERVNDNSGDLTQADAMEILETLPDDGISLPPDKEEYDERQFRLDVLDHTFRALAMLGLSAGLAEEAGLTQAEAMEILKRREKLIDVLAIYNRNIDLILAGD